MARNIKEVTKHIRQCIKREGIKARVRISPVCGADAVQVFTLAPNEFFAAREIMLIARICRLNGLTHVKGDTIDEAHEMRLTGKQQFDFFLYA